MNFMRIAPLIILLVALATRLPAQTRIADVVMHDGDVPVRLVGYGLVVGLDGTGDRSFGTSSGSVQTVRSVTNLLRRFNIEIPADRLRLRNVAAVLVTAEVSPFLRPGGKFEIQVASLGDATSLRGGVLWMTPLIADADGRPVATAQGALPGIVDAKNRWSAANRGGSSARVSDAGLLESALPAATVATAAPLLALRTPDLALASRIAAAINAARGAGTARVQDPGAVALKSPAGSADSLPSLLAAIDTLVIDVPQSAHIVIDARTGTVVAGGNVPVGKAVVSFKGITVRVGGDTASKSGDGVLALGRGANAQDVASGLHALGAQPADVAAVFDALRSSGAIAATVVIR